MVPLHRYGGEAVPASERGCQRPALSSFLSRSSRSSLPGSVAQQLRAIVTVESCSNCRSLSVLFHRAWDQTVGCTVSFVSGCQWSYPWYKAAISLQGTPPKTVLKHCNCQGFPMDCPSGWTERPNTATNTMLLLWLDSIKCSISLWGKLDQLCHLQCHLQRITTHLGLLNSINNCKIEGMPKTVNVESSIFLSSNLYCHSIPGPAHVGCSIVTLPTTVGELDIHPE